MKVELVRYQDWIGREEAVRATISSSAVAALAAMLDLDQAPQEGEPLPPGWQWIFFNPVARASALGADGHPKRGGFLPPVLLPRRMWAGSRLRYLAPLTVGAEAVRRSKILKVEEKTGRGGALVFVTVEHTTESAGATCIIEEQDIVYREPPPPGAAAMPTRYDGEAQWRRDIVPSTTLLFRYSALTANGHRIHYDQAYARGEEGYPDLVVQGPLTATLLHMFAHEHGSGRRMIRFEFRGVTPLFVDRAFQLEGREADAATLDIWARGPDGELAMSAKAGFA